MIPRPLPWTSTPFAPSRWLPSCKASAAGPGLHARNARITGFDPGLAPAVELDFSHALLQKFDTGRFDAVIVRHEGSRRGGEVLGDDTFGWFAAAAFRRKPGDKLRLAM